MEKGKNIVDYNVVDEICWKASPLILSLYFCAVLNVGSYILFIIFVYLTAVKKFFSSHFCLYNCIYPFLFAVTVEFPFSKQINDLRQVSLIQATPVGLYVV